MDKHHGHGGSYQVNKTTGARELVKGSRTEAHEGGDAPRDAEGKLIKDKAIEQSHQPQQALPEPAKTAPWATPELPADTTAKKKGA